METIYVSKECDLALNIYEGCTHGCIYCSVPLILKTDRANFHACVRPRVGILEATKARLSEGDIKGREISLCLSCDPFPKGADTSVTYDIIKAIKDSGNNVAILTKGTVDKDRLFAMLDSNDRFGVTISCGAELAKKYEPNAALVAERLDYLASAKLHKIKTYVSFEPVLEPDYIYFLITQLRKSMDECVIGKLNYFKKEIDWRNFGFMCERLCKKARVTYQIKESLRAEMDRPTRASKEFQ